MTTRDEQWKAIDGYDGAYEISSHGRVRSFHRTRHGVNFSVAPRIIGGSQKRNGYRYVHLATPAGRKVTHTVHGLVLRAFIGRPPSLAHECRHLDGDKTNNRLENLVWGTRSENTKDQIAHGTFNQPSQYRWK